LAVGRTKSPGINPINWIIEDINPVDHLHAKALIPCHFRTLPGFSFNRKGFVFRAFFGKTLTIVEAVKEERMTASGKIWGVSLIALAKREEWNHDLELIGMVSPYFSP
jgi:hypothetical protein